MQTCAIGSLLSEIRRKGERQRATRLGGQVKTDDDGRRTGGGAWRNVMAAVLQPPGQGTKTMKM
ncbi:MarR family transcriptional regulator [Sesbania bispinosa]|nr:MarR family transcriptional regulator [Sesbania bispinosa]